MYVAAICAAATTAAGCQAFLSIDDTADRSTGDASTADGAFPFPSDGSAQADVDLADSASVDGSSLTYSEVVMSDGPVAYLRFDEAAGATKLTDVAGNHSAIPNQGADLGMVGALGTGNALGPTNGDMSFAETFSIGGSAQVTIEALAYLEDANGKWEVGLGDDDANGFTLLIGYAGVGSPQAIFARHCCGYYDKATSVAPTKRFFHVAGVYDGASARLYIDGNEVDATSSAEPLVAGPLTLQLAVYAGTRIDELAIYTKALTAERVGAHCRAAGACP